MQLYSHISFLMDVLDFLLILLHCFYEVWRLTLLFKIIFKITCIKNMALSAVLPNIPNFKSALSKLRSLAPIPFSLFRINNRNLLTTHACNVTLDSYSCFEAQLLVANLNILHLNTIIWNGSMGCSANKVIASLKSYEKPICQIIYILRKYLFT